MLNIAKYHIQIHQCWKRNSDSYWLILDFSFLVKSTTSHIPLCTVYYLNAYTITDKFWAEENKLLSPLKYHHRKQLQKWGGRLAGAICDHTWGSFNCIKGKKWDQTRQNFPLSSLDLAIRSTKEAVSVRRYLTSPVSEVHSYCSNKLSYCQGRFNFRHLQW